MDGGFIIVVTVRMLGSDVKAVREVKRAALAGRRHPSHVTNLLSGPEPIEGPLGHDYDLDHNASLSRQLGELFDSGRGCDLNISVVVDDTNVETICTHGVILSLMNTNLQTSQPDFSRLSIDVTSDCREHANTFVR